MCVLGWWVVEWSFNVIFMISWGVEMIGGDYVVVIIILILVFLLVREI